MSPIVRHSPSGEPVEVPFDCASRRRTRVSQLMMSWDAYERVSAAGLVVEEPVAAAGAT
jgi:hypothetical protein